MTAQADIGVVGLAVMGRNLVLNMDDHGVVVSVFNRTTSKVDEFIAGEAAGTAATRMEPRDCRSSAILPEHATRSAR